MKAMYAIEAELFIGLRL